MSENDFHATVIGSLATIQANVKWIMVIGSVLIGLAGTGMGTLWMRTETNALGVATVQAAMVQHYEEVLHNEPMD